MESEHGAEDKSPHTGRKTHPIYSAAKLFPPSGPFKNMLEALICLLNVCLNVPFESNMSILTTGFKNNFY